MEYSLRSAALVSVGTRATDREPNITNRLAYPGCSMLGFVYMRRLVRLTGARRSKMILKIEDTATHVLGDHISTGHGVP